MKKGVKKYVIVGVVLIVLLFGVLLFNKITGKVTDASEEAESVSEEEPDCMKTCVSTGCDSSDLVCMQTNINTCMEECNLKKLKPALVSDPNCTENCLMQDCESTDKICLDKDKYKCRKECNAIVAPVAKSEEDMCIRECINNEDSSLTCISEEGSELMEICEKCAKDCEQLYDGPCLQEIKLETKLKKCETCDGCYGSLVMGNSRQGYDCIVNVQCKDAKGNVLKQGIFARMFNFFKGMFGKEDSENISEEQTSGEEPVPEEETDSSEEGF
jgi:hypothetical protein